MVILDLEAAGNYVAVRPSGTEPKVKFYMFAYDPPAASADLSAIKAAQAARMKAFAADLRKFSGCNRRRQAFQPDLSVRLESLTYGDAGPAFYSM